MRYARTFLAALVVALAALAVRPAPQVDFTNPSAFITIDGDVYIVVDGDGNVVGY